MTETAEEGKREQTDQERRKVHYQLLCSNASPRAASGKDNADVSLHEYSSGHCFSLPTAALTTDSRSQKHGLYSAEPEFWKDWLGRERKLKRDLNGIVYTAVRKSTNHNRL